MQNLDFESKMASTNMKRKKNSAIDALFDAHRDHRPPSPPPKQLKTQKSDSSIKTGTNSRMVHQSSSSASRRPHIPGDQLQRRKSELAPIRKALPVYQFQSVIVEKLTKADVLLVVAETGSGKSTQIPAYLDNVYGGGSGNNNNKQTNPQYGQRHPTDTGSNANQRSSTQTPVRASSICVTQPRRVAAMTVAKRVAEERGCRLGTAVGYKVRFDDATTPHTRIIYATDGMVLRESMADPLLSRYTVVVLDESHERSLQTDVLFGVVQRAMRARNSTNQTDQDNVVEESSAMAMATTTTTMTIDQRIQQRMRQRAREEWHLPPLKVVVMSATLQVDTFVKFFPKAETIRIPGRMHPVQIVYTKEPQEDYLDSALVTALQIHQNAEEDGDILIFLPGQEEITDLAILLKRHLEHHKTLTDTLTGQNHDNGVDIVQSLKGMGANISYQAGTIVNGVMICVLYAALPPEAQMVAFMAKPRGCTRKIILSTNIAETSGTY